MPEIIGTEPKLFTGTKEEFVGDSEALARVNRLLSLQRSIAKRPGVYMEAFIDLGEEATSETLGIHNDAVETRSATSDPKKRIKEYFAKRDDKEIRLDEASDKTIFGSKEFKELAEISREKTTTSIKKGVMKTELRANPEAREASNAVRRYILGEYIGRVVLYEAQHSSKKIKQAG